jgi:hypothetical protein
MILENKNSNEANLINKAEKKLKEFGKQKLH